MNSVLAAFSLEPLDLQMIAVGLVLLTLLYKALESTLFRPYLTHIEKREAATAGATEVASMMRQKAAALRARFEESLLHARISANKDRLAILANAQEEAQKLVGAAESQAEAKVAAARAKLDGQISESRARLDVEARSLADLMAERVDSQLAVH